MEPGAFRQDVEKFYATELGSKTPPFRRKMRLWIRNFGLHCVTVYRFGQFSRGLNRRMKIIFLPLVILHKMLDYFMKCVHHVDIDDANIGPGFFISHVGTIYIGPVTIGRNFSLTHNVTIGVGHSEGKDGLPVIGDNVWIATGTVVSGAITIGNGVTISTASVVTRSIPDRCFVAGNPARVLMQNYDNTHLFGHTREDYPPIATTPPAQE